MIRSGEKYIASIRHSREVYINGERVKDVTKNLMMRPLHQRPVPESARGEIELAIVYNFGLQEDICAEHLADLTPNVLLPEGHPLGQSSAIALEMSPDEPLVLLDVDPSRNSFSPLFRDSGLEPLVGYRRASLEMVRGLVGHGLGYSLLARRPPTTCPTTGVH